jgi:hypothetical protein
MQLTSNLGWRNSNGDPGMLIYTSYGTPSTTTNYYGLAQTSGGVLRNVISGIFNAAKSSVCRAGNNALTSFTDLMTVDALTATCQASNFTAQNIISCLNNATVSGKINCSTYDNAGANINFMNGAFTLSSVF